MDKPFKFVLPSPNFNKDIRDKCKSKLHYLIPSGMSLLPREKQPPPMYGECGATVPARYLKARDAKEPQLLTADFSNPVEKQYCEPCEQELHSLEDLKRHRAQHEKCPVAGCLYKGHPSVMDKHVGALHSSGLFDKFKKLSTPEEIAAWREERRKRYPTLANVLLKQKAKEQRQKRGELLENKARFGKINDRKRAQPNTQEREYSGDKRKREENKPCRNKKSRKNKNNRKSIAQDSKPKVQNNVKQKVINTEDGLVSCGAIKMFRGTSHLENYKHFNSKKNADSNNILFGLVGMYGSDDDEEPEESNDGDGEKINAIERNKVEITEILKSDHNLNVPILENMTNSLTIESIATSTFVQNSDLPDTVSEGSPALDTFSKLADKPEIKYPALNIFSVNTTPVVNLEKPVLNETMTTDISKLSDDNTKENVLNESKTTNTFKLKNDSSDEAPEELPIQRNMSHYPSKPVNILNVSVDKSDTKQNKNDHVTAFKKVTKRKFGLDYRKARLRKQNTMLEKLLETDIRHERNVLLQCVRYVCENNFFNSLNKNQGNLGKLLP